MVQQVMGDPESALPMSGIGGIATWQDAAEFILLGAGTVQVCTAVMHYGYRIVEDMADGLLAWMRRKEFSTLDDFRGRSLPHVTDWKNLNLNYKIVAQIHAEKCIGCQLCYTACWDGAHQCIHLDRTSPQPDTKRTPQGIAALASTRITTTPIPKLDLNGEGIDFDGPFRTPLSRIPRVDEEECVGCNLCSLVCPVPDCITMEPVDNGLTPQTWEERVAAGIVPEGEHSLPNPNA
jgi:dihydropyrimidine dehydrogenase (NAD+) subunit PreA